jgi:peptidoglycan/LPS O-acetylase OafA/YrhL
MPGLRKTLDRLTVLRAFAAVAIFAFHIGGDGEWRAGKLAADGYAGVAFFFILSGFILIWSTGPETRPSVFYRRRFARIYPSYIVMTFVALVVPVVAYGRSLTTAVLSFVVLQAWVPGSHILWGLNGVSWSLSCEAFFYLLFPLLATKMRSLSDRALIATVLTALAVGTAVIVVLTVVSADEHNALLNDMAFCNPLVNLPIFMLGMGAGILVTRGWRPPLPSWAPVVLIVALYGFAGVVHLHKPLMDAVMPLPLVALITACAIADLADRPGWLTARWLIYGGEASYCFYLVHELVILNVRPYLTGFSGTVVCFVGACIGALVLHEIVEIPCQRLLRPRGKPNVDNKSFLTTV